MTTIVCDRTEMAGDSLLSGDVGNSARKVWKHKGNCIGIAGTYVEAVKFIAWYKNKKNPEPDMAEVEAMVLTKAGRIWHYDSDLTPYEINDDFSAIGTGQQAALAAMYMGATPQQAVEIAIKVDPKSGGTVHTRRRGK